MTEPFLVRLVRLLHPLLLILASIALVAYHAPFHTPTWGVGWRGGGIFFLLAALATLSSAYLGLGDLGPQEQKRLLRRRLLWRTGLALGFLLAVTDPGDFLEGVTELHGRANLVRAWGQVVLVFWIALGLEQLYHWGSQHWENPAVLFAGSFAALIAIGTLLLMLPRAHSNTKDPASFSTALFTATSAVCVTGLIVKDTDAYWSREGQWVILVLFQMGGLGIATLGAYLVRMLGERPTLRETVLQGRLLEHEVPGEVHRLLETIVLVTLLAEVLGAFLLSGLWAGRPLAERVFFSVFHSVSAFCNAGFSVQKGGMEGQGEHWQVRWVIPFLIILGGLGFGVHRNLWEGFSIRVRRWWARARNRPAPPPGPGTWTLTTRLVVTTSLLLLVLGTVGIFLLELGNPRVERTTWENLDVAWFHSVSCRTAGFNTVHLGQLADATKFLMVVLMFIGASPGSTGGGVKTVPAAVLALILRTTWRRRQDVELAHRRLPIHLTRQALLIITLAATILVLLTLALTTVEGGKEPFLSYLFEVASALGTVGLTTGITGDLGEPGRLVLIVGMFVGRIGPFTLVLAVARREEKLHYEYPEEGVALG